MKINNIESIDETKGKFLIVTDYGCEGLSITSQHESAMEAIKNYGNGDSQAILLLPDFNFELTDDENGELI